MEKFEHRHSASRDSLKISKKNLLIIILAIIAIAGLAYYFLKYAPEQKRNREINSYKKAIYDSILCQYKCPLKNYTFQNQTQLLQDKECVVECISGLKSLGYVKDQYSNNEINKDSLAQEIDTIVSNCRKDNTNNITKNADSKNMTDCAIFGLESLKQTYAYLN